MTQEEEGKKFNYFIFQKLLKNDSFLNLIIGEEGPEYFSYGSSKI